MKVNFVSCADEKTASFRMRAQIPCTYLNEVPNMEAKVSRSYDPNADVNVFGKHWNQEEDMKALYEAETKTIFDTCDNHFDRNLGSYYKFMCTHADVLTCNSQNMKDCIYEVTGRTARVINDPCTFPRLRPREITQNPKILWFGHRVNIFSVYRWMFKVPNLTIISNLDMPDMPKHVKFQRWEPNLVETEIANYDIVILPRNTFDWAKTKSPNRAADAIMSGKFVITDFGEVYKPYEDYIFTGDVQDGLAFYREYPELVQNMIECGQEFVLGMNGPDSITNGWLNAFRQERTL